jgi:hypothetical protein
VTGYCRRSAKIKRGRAEYPMAIQMKIGPAPARSRTENAHQ